jgi:hypothetical protein
MPGLFWTAVYKDHDQAGQDGLGFFKQAVSDFRSVTIGLLDIYRVAECSRLPDARIALSAFIGLSWQNPTHYALRFDRLPVTFRSPGLLHNVTAKLPSPLLATPTYPGASEQTPPHGVQLTMVFNPNPSLGDTVSVALLKNEGMSIRIEPKPSTQILRE